MIDYKIDTQICSKQLLYLYDAVGWKAYTNEPDKLLAAVNQSFSVVTAWEKEVLVGLVRVVGDGVTIVYIQDLLVLPAYQNHGIGFTLMEIIKTKYKQVRQKVLLTEEAPDVRYFYEKCGYTSCDQGRAVAFYREF